jgi:hypothetical protein
LGTASKIVLVSRHAIALTLRFTYSVIFLRARCGRAEACFRLSFACGSMATFLPSRPVASDALVAVLHTPRAIHRSGGEIYQENGKGDCGY